jgi:hypothetical protein
VRPGREHALQAAQVEVEAIGMPTVCTDKITAMRQTDRQTDRHRRQVRKRDVADMVFLFWVQRVVFLIVVESGDGVERSKGVEGVVEMEARGWWWWWW